MSVNPTMPTASLYMRKDSKIRKPNSGSRQVSCVTVKAAISWKPAYWLGKYSDMPHILSFLNESYQTIFEVLETDNEVAPLLGPFQTAFKNKAMEQLEGMIGTLRVYTSRLATKESYWIFHRDGDDFDLKVSDPKNPSYLLIANDPEMESIIGALNALILNRLVTRVNTGQGEKYSCEYYSGRVTDTLLSQNRPSDRYSAKQ